MQLVGPCVAPNESDFLAAFGVVADESEPSGGYWVYTFEDEAGFSVRLSFNTHERSVQTVLAHGADALATISFEGASRISIDEDESVVTAEFALMPNDVRMVLRVRPRLELV